MFRLRRSRLFLIVAVIVVGLFYHFNRIENIQSAGAVSVERLKHLGQNVKSTTTKAEEPEITGTGDPLIGASEERSVRSTIPTSAPQGKSNLEPTHEKSQQSLQDEKSDDHLVRIPQKLDEEASSSKQISSTKDEEDESSVPKLPSLPRPSEQSKGKLQQESETEKDAKDSPTTSEDSKGRLQIIGDTEIPKIYWSKLPEHFPVPTESLITLPTANPRKIPKIQYNFAADKSASTVQQDKLDVIKGTFSFSWAGYRKKAWKQDELSPESGKYKNKFCGWGATLVDSLDALWMMGMKSEFEEAVEAVAETDFTTSLRNDIPLFETVIRYLGGLISAYDISGGSQRILLDKAVELAEVLIGAFDTPNRMPMTFYLWKPTFASQPHRAKTNVVLAELGSLSLEFTRLAQITKEHKYYDAIARITNELELWQGETKLPGLWPLRLDASGCKKQTRKILTTEEHKGNNVRKAKPALSPAENAPDVSKHADVIAPDEDAVLDGKGITEEASSNRQLPNSERVHNSQGDAKAIEGKRPRSKETSTSSTPGLIKQKREPATDRPIASTNESSAVAPQVPEGEDHCEPQGLASAPFLPADEYGLGGQADSVYEYLPKEYILLGGAESKYRSMYDFAADASKKHLLFRPMIKDEKRSILQAGLVKIESKATSRRESDFQPEGSHLTCFVGGMFALGAKIFERPDDLEIARKLTDGCVWAYESMKTGIMPETFFSVACDQLDSCPWNETRWREKLDPSGPQREAQRLKIQTQKPLGVRPQSASISDDEVLQKPVEQDKEIKSESSKSKEKALMDEEEASAAPVSANKKSDMTIQQTKGSASDKTQEEPVEAKLLKESDAAEALPLPENGPGKSKESSPTTADKQARHKRQLGEIDDDSASRESKVPIRQDHELDQPASAKLSKNPADSTDHQPLPTNGRESPTEDIAKEAEVGESKKGSSSQRTAKSGPLKDKPDSADEESGEDSSTTLASKKGSGSRQDSVKSTPPLPTHDEYVDARIKKEGLPPGMTKIGSSRYILRPEAIESVFIMYRVTGDDYWRKRGWEMFEAIKQHTNSTFGASAILDVTKEDPKRLDEMESFWLAETLKYFWLLFSDPSVVSLDEYVLNTEAHPFRRPTNG